MHRLSVHLTSEQETLLREVTAKTAEVLELVTSKTMNNAPAPVAKAPTVDSVVGAAPSDLEDPGSSPVSPSSKVDSPSVARSVAFDLSVPTSETEESGSDSETDSEEDGDKFEQELKERKILDKVAVAVDVDVSDCGEKKESGDGVGATVKEEESNKVGSV